ncbi:hypothetical protein LXL04_027267 [Taraxacum kok-saghyz]
MDIQQSIANQTHVSITLANHLLSKKSLNSNTVFSPLSIHVDLGLVADGSSGQTLDQLLSFLKTETIDEHNSLSSQLVSLVFADGSPSGGPRGYPFSSNPLTFLSAIGESKSEKKIRRKFITTIRFDGGKMKKKIREDLVPDTEISVDENLENSETAGNLIIIFNCRCCSIVVGVALPTTAAAKTRWGKDEVQLSLSLLSIRYYEKIDFNNRK